MPTDLPPADLILRTPAGRTVAVVEVKARFGGDPGGAVRERVLSQAFVADADFAALLTSDRLRVWRADGGVAADADAKPILAPFFRKAGVLGDRVGGGAFEMLAALALRVLCDPRPSSWGSEFAAVGHAFREAAPEFAAAIEGAEVRSPTYDRIPDPDRAWAAA